MTAMSFDLLHATKRRCPSDDGWAQVGEQATSPGLGGSVPCPPTSWLAGWAVAAVVVGAGAGVGAPITPFSFPLVTTKCRATLSVRVSISTARSSIMHAE